MKLRDFLFSQLAGVGATTVHLGLMELKHRAAILPSFEPYDDLQRLVSSATGYVLEPPLSWLLPYVNGALILGFLFARLFSRLPGRTPLGKGAVFGLGAWLMLGFGLLPLAGRGIFGSELGLGVLPAALMLAMLMTYAIVMSLLYARLLQAARSRTTR